MDRASVLQDFFLFFYGPWVRLPRLCPIESRAKFLRPTPEDDKPSLMPSRGGYITGRGLCGPQWQLLALQDAGRHRER